MCARDPSQTHSLRQTNSLHCLKELIDFSLYPICVRDTNGLFVLTNISFEQEMLYGNRNADGWFSGLPIDISLLLSESELISYSQNCPFLTPLSLVMNGSIWDVCFQVLSFKKNNYSVWHFYHPSINNKLSIGKLPSKYQKISVYDYRNDNTLLHWNVLNLYLSGFSHESISRILSISVGSSKNYITDAHRFFKTKSRDDIIIFMYVSGFYLNVSRDVKRILTSNVSKLLMNQ